MKGVELYGRVRHAVRIEGLSERAAARRSAMASNSIRRRPRAATPSSSRSSAVSLARTFSLISTVGWAFIPRRTVWVGSVLHDAPMIALGCFFGICVASVHFQNGCTLGKMQLNPRNLIFFKYPFWPLDIDV